MAKENILMSLGPVMTVIGSTTSTTELAQKFGLTTPCFRASTEREGNMEGVDSCGQTEALSKEIS